MNVILKIIKWGTAMILLLVVLAIVYLFATRDVRDAKVVEEIRELPNGDLAMRTMLIHLPDGRMYPVNYLKEQGKVFIGIDGLWWRQFETKDQYVEMEIQGEKIYGTARLLENDLVYKKDIFSRLRPTAPAWLPDRLNGKLVGITLDNLPN